MAGAGPDGVTARRSPRCARAAGPDRGRDFAAARRSGRRSARPPGAIGPGPARTAGLPPACRCRGAVPGAGRGAQA